VPPLPLALTLFEQEQDFAVVDQALFDTPLEVMLSQNSSSEETLDSPGTEIP
jgi:hypothetical protein